MCVPRPNDATHNQQEHICSCGSIRSDVSSARRPYTKCAQTVWVKSIDGGLRGERQRPCSSQSTRGVARQFRVYSRILTWHTHAGPTCNGYDVCILVQTIGFFNSTASSLAPCDSSLCLPAYSCLGPRCLMCQPCLRLHVEYMLLLLDFFPPETQHFPSRFLHSFNRSVFVSVCRPWVRHAACERTCLA